jgi:hypothetical protein
MYRMLVALAAGYILGARAGRARYDQIIGVVQRVADHPAIQGTAGLLQAKLVRLLHPGQDVRRPDAAYLDSADPAPSTVMAPATSSTAT